MARRTRRLALAWAFALGACDRAPAPEPEPPAPAAEQSKFSPPPSDLGQRLSDAAAQLAPGLILDAAVFQDRLAHAAQRDFLAVLVTEHCYRVLGVGDSNVANLDLVLFDPNGVQIRRDLDESPQATLGVDAELCPVLPGAYRLNARMTAGEGEILVGIYRTPQ